MNGFYFSWINEFVYVINTYEENILFFMQVKAVNKVVKPLIPTNVCVKIM